MRATRTVQLSAAVWGLLIGLGLAIALAACAAQGTAMTRAESDTQKIERLWNEIGDWRESRGMSRDPIIDLKRPRPEFFQTPDQIRQCPDDGEPPKTDACSDVCSLKDDICDHAASICRIADNLRDDAWARGKCNSAKASCKEATEKCCECAADERSAPPAPDLIQ